MARWRRASITGLLSVAAVGVSSCSEVPDFPIEFSVCVNSTMNEGTQLWTAELVWDASMLSSDDKLDILIAPPEPMSVRDAGEEALAVGWDSLTLSVADHAEIRLEVEVWDEHLGDVLALKHSSVVIDDVERGEHEIVYEDGYSSDSNRDLSRWRAAVGILDEDSRLVGVDVAGDVQACE